MTRVMIDNIRSFDIDMDEATSVSVSSSIKIDRFPTEIGFDLVIRSREGFRPGTNLKLVCLDKRGSTLTEKYLTASGQEVVNTVACRFVSQEDFLRFEIYRDHERLGSCEISPEISFSLDSPDILRKAKMAVKQGSKITFSQCGEDIIIAAALKDLGVQSPTYLDIGAFHPSCISNTYLLYLNGARGVCVDPNYSFADAYRVMRPRDVFLAVGVAVSAPHPESAPYYIMTDAALNTFSKEEAYRLQQMGEYQIRNVIKLPLLSINKIIETHFRGGWPNILSIDVEGSDLQILTTMDFGKYRPEIIAVESTAFEDPVGSKEKNARITAFMESKQYSLHAFTGLNSIFVEKGALQRASGHSVQS